MARGPRRIVVVGGGISGLSAAYFLRRRLPDAKIVLLEARERTGGNIRTEATGGFVIDAGPDSFLRTKPAAVKLCAELGLESELVRPRPESRHVFMVHHGELVPLPAGMVLAVPTRLGPMLRTSVMSLPAKLRMLGDLVMPVGFGGPGAGRDESVGSFVARRFGREAAERIASPLLGGIYAGDVSELSLRATFPQLADLERRYGSVILGLCAPSAGLPEGAPTSLAERIERVKTVVAWLKRDEPASHESPFVSFRGGMSRLIGRLAEPLGNDLRVGVPARRITQDGSGKGYRVEVDGDTLDADAVLLTTPAHVAAELVPDQELSRELAGIRYTSTATIFFAFERASVAHPLAGSGFIVPKGENDLIAGTWVSSKWDARAPEGGVLMRAFVGGTSGQAVLARSDEELVAIARFELERLLGPLGEPLFTRVYRYERSNPLPDVGHPQRLERLRARTSALPGLELSGAAYDGVGIPDCVRQADAAAERIARALGA
jgi:oxygen-dependent protoporphyrinogen oxidase